MPSADPNAVPIPVDWCSSVAAILRRGDQSKIQTTFQADTDWGQAFPAAWLYDRADAMAAALDVPGVLGRLITGMTPAGEVYAFWFYFETQKLYGKINLLPNGRILLLLSSHIPRKGQDFL